MSRTVFEVYTGCYSCGAKTADLCKPSLDKRLDSHLVGPSAEARAIKSYLSTCGPNKAYHDILKHQGRDLPPEDLQTAIINERKRSEKIAELLPAAHDMRTQNVRIGELHGEFILPDGQTTTVPERVVLFIHRSLVAGSYRPFREFLSAVATRGGVRVLAFDYSLAPEAVWPAQLTDVMRVYEWLVDVAHAEQIVLMGDSDGAGVVAHAVAAILQRGWPPPLGAIMISPIIDFGFRYESVETNDERDVVMSGKNARAFYRQVVLAGMPPDAVTLPALGELALWRDVPLLIIAGGDEAVLDDCLQFAERATAAGVVVYLEVRDGLFHGFPAFYPYLPEAEEALDRVGEYLQTIRPPGPPGPRPAANGHGPVNGYGAASGYAANGSGVYQNGGYRPLNGARPWTGPGPAPGPGLGPRPRLSISSSDRPPTPPPYAGPAPYGPPPPHGPPLPLPPPPEGRFSFFGPHEPPPPGGWPAGGPPPLRRMTAGDGRGVARAPERFLTGQYPVERESGAVLGHSQVIYASPSAGPILVEDGVPIFPAAPLASQVLPVWSRDPRPFDAPPPYHEASRYAPPPERAGRASAASGRGTVRRRRTASRGESSSSSSSDEGRGGGRRATHGRPQAGSYVVEGGGSWPAYPRGSAHGAVRGPDRTPGGVYRPTADRTPGGVYDRTPGGVYGEGPARRASAEHERWGPHGR